MFQLGAITQEPRDGVVVEDLSKLLLRHGCRDGIDCCLGVGREDGVAWCVDGVADERRVVVFTPVRQYERFTNRALRLVNRPSD